MNEFFYRLLSEPFLISDSFLVAFLAAYEKQTDNLAASPIYRELRSTHRINYENQGGTAVVPVEGALMRKPGIWSLMSGNAEDSESVVTAIEKAAADKDVREIVIKMDSPGGSLLGGPEMANAVSEADKIKPTVVHSSGSIQSLAYMVASQGRETVVTPSAQVGSIGAYNSVTNISKMLERVGISIETFTNKEGDLKAIGAPGSSLTEKQREHMQERAQAAFDLFKGMVQARRPGVTAESMRGQSFYGAEAKKLGLVDRIGDLNFAIGVARSHTRKRA